MKAALALYRIYRHYYSPLQALKRTIHAYRSTK